MECDDDDPTEPLIIIVEEEAATRAHPRCRCTLLCAVLTLAACGGLVAPSLLTPFTSTTMMKRNVTLFSLTSSNSPLYLMHTLLLHASIRRFVPHQTLHLLVTDDVHPWIERNLLRSIATTHVIHPYPGEPSRPHPNDTHISRLHPSWIHQLSKVKLWSMANLSAVVCYLDSDLIFFGDSALQGVVAECWNGLHGAGAEWCGFDNEDPNGNDTHWRMKTIQANFFCLKPSAGLLAQLEREVVRDVFASGRLFYKGMYVATEQDALNLFFNGRIHFVSKRRPDGGRFHHSNWNLYIWIAWCVVCCARGVMMLMVAFQKQVPRAGAVHRRRLTPSFLGGV